MVVLVTGANGQLGQALRFVSTDYPEMNFVFCGSSELDITNKANCEAVFEKYKPDFCINTAAYTAVDKAESELERARLINVIGAENIAETCKNHNTLLFHISTDFVFDGEKLTPYSEEDVPNPTGVYGQTKLEGEHAVQNSWEKHFIIRTSWVYSQFGNNFMKTMLRLASERDTLSVVNDQIGTPTHAVDLAKALIEMIVFCYAEPDEASYFGIYNFSNEGQCSWFDFAKKIIEVNGISIALNPISTTDYPTPAQRPKYSVLDKTKIKKTFGLEIKKWEKSLQPFPSAV